MACNTWRKYRAFGVDVHAEYLGRWTKGADRLYLGITRLVPSRHLDRSTHAATDHRPVCVLLSRKMWCGTKPNITKKQRSLKHRQPGNKWTENITETLKDADLEDWTEWAAKVRDTAQGSGKDTKRSIDPTLMSLLAQLKTVFGTDAEERKKLSTRIWRRKRHPKRAAIEQVIQSAAADGRAPERWTFSSGMGLKNSDFNFFFGFFFLFSSLFLFISIFCFQVRFFLFF